MGISKTVTDIMGDWQWLSIGHVTLVAIAGTTVLVSYL